MEKLEGFNPDIELDRGEQSSLAAILAQPGFKVLQKIGKACVDQFVVSWINQTKEEDVLRAHRHAKVAAQFYTAFLQTVHNEVSDYIHSQPQDKPVDSTEALDIGEHVAYGADLEEEPIV